MIKYILILSALVAFNVHAQEQIHPVQNKGNYDLFDEKLFLHLVHDGLIETQDLYQNWKAKNEVIISENLIEYSYKKPIKKENLTQINNPEIALDLVKRDIISKDYMNALTLINNIRVSDLSNDYRDDYQFLRAYLLFVHKDFEKARKIFDTAESLKGEFKYPSIYYSAFCDMFSGAYESSSQKFSRLNSQKKYRKELPYYQSILKYKQENFKEVIDILDREVAFTSSIHKASMKELLSRALYKESNWNKLSKVLLSDANCCQNMEQHYFVGLSLYKQGKTKECIPHLTAATKMNSEEAQNALLALGSIYINRNPDLSIPFYTKASQMSYNIALKEQALISLAYYYENENKPAEALHILRRIGEGSEYFSIALEAETRVLYAQKEYKKALNSILRINKLNTETGKLYHDLLVKNGNIALTNGEISKAIQYLTEASQLSLHPKSSQKAVHLLASIYFKQKDYGKTIALASQFEKMKSSDFTISLQLEYMKAYAHLNKDEYKSSITAFNKSEQLIKAAFRVEALPIYESQYEDILLRLADCHLLLGQKNMAEQRYTQAYEQRVNHGDYALYQKGKLEDLQDEPFLQIDTYEKLEQEYPNSKYLVDSQLKKGNILLQLGKDKEAYDQFVKIYTSEIATQSHKFDALMRLGLINYNQGDVESALVYYKKLFEGHKLNSNQSKEALIVIEEIYLNNLKDAEGYYTFLENIGSQKIDLVDKDSITYFLAYSEIKNSKEVALNKLESYVKRYENGNYRIPALLEIGKIRESKSDHKGAIKAYKSLINISEKYTILSLERIIYNLGKLEDRYEEYILYNKKLLALNTSKDQNQKIYARIAKAAVLGGIVSDNQKAILLALEGQELSDNNKENIRLSLAKSFTTERYYSKAITHLKILAKSKNESISSEALFLVSERLYHMNKPDETLVVLNKLLQKENLNKNILAKSIIIQCLIYLDKDQLDLASAGIESILQQIGIKSDILKDADEVMKSIKKRKKEISAASNPTIELEYATNE